MQMTKEMKHYKKTGGKGTMIFLFKEPNRKNL